MARERRGAARDTQAKSRRDNRGVADPADWGNANPALVMAAITNVTRDGGAIRFGYTRDGGAFAIGILGDGEPYTDYVRPSEDIDVYLQALALDFEPGQ